MHEKDKTLFCSPARGDEVGSRRIGILNVAPYVGGVHGDWEECHGHNTLGVGDSGGRVRVKVLSAIRLGAEAGRRMIRIILSVCRPIPLFVSQNQHKLTAI